MSAADAPEAVNAELLARIGHNFADAALLENALTHSSLAHSASARKRARSNEQMEFLGDAVLGMVVAGGLYRNHGDADEGRMTRLRAALVSRRNLARVAGRLRLGAELRLGRGEERSGGRQKSALLADALEAVIAAVYLDGGLAAAAGLIEREILAPSKDSVPLAEIEDWKSAVQEWLQARGRARATYGLLSAEGLDHDKRFTVELRVDGRPLSQSTASKKQAEQACARAALATLRAQEPAATQAGR